MDTKFIPDRDQLRADVSAIFIDEDLNYSMCLEQLKYHLNPKNPGNIPDLTYELVLSRYRAHISLWTKRYGKKAESGFIQKADAMKRKNFLNFLGLKMYTIDFDAQSESPTRDLYLFGDIATEFLTKQRKAFVNSLQMA